MIQTRQRIDYRAVAGTIVVHPKGWDDAATVEQASAKASDMKPFFKWAITKGSSLGVPLLFLPLPSVVVKADMKTIARIHP